MGSNTVKTANGLLAVGADTVDVACDDPCHEVLIIPSPLTDILTESDPMLFRLGGQEMANAHAPVVKKTCVAQAMLIITLSMKPGMLTHAPFARNRNSLRSSDCISDAWLDTS